MNKIVAKAILGAAAGAGAAFAKRAVETFLAGRAMRQAQDLECRRAAQIEELRRAGGSAAQMEILRLEREVQAAYRIAGARHPGAAEASRRADRRALLREARAKDSTLSATR